MVGQVKQITGDSQNGKRSYEFELLEYGETVSQPILTLNINDVLIVISALNSAAIAFIFIWLIKIKRGSI